MKILAISMMFFVIGCCLCCYCPYWPLDLEQEYCTSDLVILGKPILENYTDWRIIYKVEVTETFKAPDNVKSGDILTIVTSRNSCGGHLWLNEDSVITGLLHDNTFWFGACSFRSRLQYLTEKELSLFEDGIQC